MTSSASDQITRHGFWCLGVLVARGITIREGLKEGGPTGFSSEIGTKLRDWAVGQV